MHIIWNFQILKNESGIIYLKHTCRISQSAPYPFPYSKQIEICMKLDKIEVMVSILLMLQKVTACQNPLYKNITNILSLIIFRQLAIIKYKLYFRNKQEYIQVM